MHTPLNKIYIVKLQHSIIIIRCFVSQKLNLHQEKDDTADIRVNGGFYGLIAMVYSYKFRA